MSGDSSTADGNIILSLSTQVITNILITISIISGFIVSVFMKIKSAMQKSERESIKKAATIMEEYVIPLLEETSKIAETTKKQEVKFKQISDVVYEAMGEEEANKITNKPEIKQVNLTKDIEVAQKTAEEYKAKLERAKTLQSQIHTLVDELDKI